MVNQPDPNMMNNQQPQYQQAPPQPQYQQQPPQYQQPQYQPPQPQVVMFDQEDVMQNRPLAILAYLCMPLALIQNIKIKSDFVAYHLNYMVQLLVFEIVAMFIASLLCIVFIGFLLLPVVSIMALVFWVMGILSAKNGIGKPMPIIGAKMPVPFIK